MKDSEIVSHLFDQVRPTCSQTEVMGLCGVLARLRQRELADEIVEEYRRELCYDNRILIIDLGCVCVVRLEKGIVPDHWLDTPLFDYVLEQGVGLVRQSFDLLRADIDALNERFGWKFGKWMKISESACTPSGKIISGYGYNTWRYEY